MSLFQCSWIILEWCGKNDKSRIRKNEQSRDKGKPEKSYSKANNESCSVYDEEKPENHNNYLDINNLYGGAMSENKYSPYGRFKWVKKLLMKQLIEY